GSFTHGRACDPVVTDGNFAYVTLHSGSQCGGTSNELDIIDIKNIEQAFLVKSYPMTSPTGLSKDGDLLFICDGSEIKLYNAADANDIKAVGSIETKEPYDVIAGNKIALVVAKDGLYQYDYSDVHHMHQLSFIATK
ncbi:MAG TPA: hypothetical protein VGO09_02540, partial [Flavisolibacter sp.]|nr:hypothetical protein [Flavisolibacter sp.]